MGKLRPRKARSPKPQTNSWERLTRKWDSGPRVSCGRRAPLHVFPPAWTRLDPEAQTSTEPRHGEGTETLRAKKKSRKSQPRLAAASASAHRRGGGEGEGEGEDALRKDLRALAPPSHFPSPDSRSGAPQTRSVRRTTASSSHRAVPACPSQIPWTLKGVTIFPFPSGAERIKALPPPPSHLLLIKKDETKLHSFPQELLSKLSISAKWGQEYK